MSVPLQPGARSLPPWSAQRLYRPYVRWALVIALTLGFTTGAAMLLLPAVNIPIGSTWTTHTQAHGVAQLFGWAGLFVMGIAFHVVPRFRGVTPPYPWPQRVTLALVLLGITLRFTGQMAATPASPALLTASGILLVAGVDAFILLMGWTLLSGSRSVGGPEPWIWAALAWAEAAAVLHLVITLQMANDNTQFATHPWNGAFIHAAAVGFIGNFIFGVSARTLPAFMSLQPSSNGLKHAAFLSVNMGVAFQVAALLMGAGAEWLGIGAALELIGIALFIAAIRLFAPRSRAREYIPGTYGRYEWFVRSAYFWLVVAGILAAWQHLGAAWPTVAFPALLAAPVLHVLALGFISMMIMGMASRMLPMFEGGQLPMHGAMDTAFVALNMSVALRLLFGLAVIPYTWVGLAVSGILGLLALGLFAWVAWTAMLPSARQTYQQTVQVIVRKRLSERGLLRPSEENQQPKGGA